MGALKFDQIRLNGFKSFVEPTHFSIEKGLTAEEIAHTIHAHPTLGEIMGEVASKAMGMPLHG